MRFVSAGKYFATMHSNYFRSSNNGFGRESAISHLWETNESSAEIARIPKFGEFTPEVIHQKIGVMSGPDSINARFASDSFFDVKIQDSKKKPRRRKHRVKFRLNPDADGYPGIPKV